MGRSGDRNRKVDDDWLMPREQKGTRLASISTAFIDSMGTSSTRERERETDRERDTTLRE